MKAKLITLLRNIKKETGLDDSTYKFMYPIGFSTLKSYELSKIHKLDTP